MQDPFDRGPALAQFQIDLTGKGQARITPQVSDGVIQSIADLDEYNSASLGRQCDISHMTANRLVRGETSPRLAVLTRMLDKLGYALYLVKNK